MSYDNGRVGQALLYPYTPGTILFSPIAGTMADDDGFEVNWKRGLIPLSLLVLFVLRFGFGAPMWVLLVLTLWVPIYYIVYPWLLKRRWRDFEQSFAVGFQQGNHQELLEEYQSRWFLRKFGPRAQMLDKLGLLYSASGKYREAEEVFERALDHAEAEERQKLCFNLANVKYELGKYDDAEEIYRSLKGSGANPYRHNIDTQLALIDLQRGTNTDEAREHLQSVRDRATGQVKERIERVLD